ncbi:sulfatase-like hydrolase/transferase [Halorubrum laminariae]|uniref:Sulfatase-like hydrolase/transferase n=1 Tax=Halorubrum laminariae TaxID=1433523 RepID=A0ABD6C1X7_9EURY|nr:sulfatase-like hydrolase/transferase [Halorubrum laminariae]
MRNIALIVLDTVRKDIFDEEAKKLKEMADVDVDCYAASSWTVPSHASMLTGKVPSEHGVHSYSPDFAQIYRDTFLNSIPHTTYGLSTNGWASPDFSFDILFDEFLHFHGSHELIPGGIDITREYNGEGSSFRYLSFFKKSRGQMLRSIANGAWVKFNDFTQGTSIPKMGDYGVRRLRKEAKEMVNEEPYFLFINFIDAHGPHENLLRYRENDVPNSWTSTIKSTIDLNETPDKDYFKKYRELYRSSISYLDQEVANLIEWLINDGTTVIVTSDHGEGLGHPDPVFGHKRLSQSVVNVPLLIINSPEVSDIDLYSHLDLPNLILGVIDGKTELREFEEVVFERIGDPDVDDQYYDKTLRGKYDGDDYTVWDEVTDIDKVFDTPICEIEKENDYTVHNQAQLEDLGYL